MDKSTEEIQIPRYLGRSGDNQGDTTLSFPSSRSQDDREYLERNRLRFFEDEDFQRLGTPLTRPKQPIARDNEQELAHEDCFYSEIDTMKTRIYILMHSSYGGQLKVAFEDFQKLKDKFRNTLSQFGVDTADLCLKVGAICYRAHVDGEALEWLNEAMEFSKRFEEKERPEHFRKLYLCLADVLIKREKWEDADTYLKKGEKMIEDYFKEDESYEGRRSLSWAQALRGHLLSRDNQYKEAKRLYKSQIELKKTLTKSNGRLEALAYDYLADFYIRHGKKDKAKPVLEKALEASRQFGKGYYTEARYFRNKARIAFEEGKIEESKELYNEAFKILAMELPEGNTLEVQYREEYNEKFGVEDVAKEESWQATNSI